MWTACRPDRIAVGVISVDMCTVFCEQLSTISSCYSQEKGALWMVFRVPGTGGVPGWGVQQLGSSFHNPLGSWPGAWEITLQNVFQSSMHPSSLLTEVSWVYMMSGARVDQNCLGIFTTIWPENLFMPPRFLFTKKECISSRTRGCFTCSVVPPTGFLTSRNKVIYLAAGWE